MNSSGNVSAWVVAQITTTLASAFLASDTPLQRPGNRALLAVRRWSTPGHSDHSIATSDSTAARWTQVTTTS